MPWKPYHQHHFWFQWLHLLSKHFGKLTLLFSLQPQYGCLDCIIIVIIVIFIIIVIVIVIIITITIIIIIIVVVVVIIVLVLVIIIIISIIIVLLLLSLLILLLFFVVIIITTYNYYHYNYYLCIYIWFVSIGLCNASCWNDRTFSSTRKLICLETYVMRPVWEFSSFNVWMMKSFICHSNKTKHIQ